MLNVSIIGAGRLGGALALALDQCGYKIQSLVSRNLENLQSFAQKLVSRPLLSTVSDIDQIKFATIVLIATPDVAINTIAERLAATNFFSRAKQTVFLHTSGALSSEVLRPLKKINGSMGSLHPLISVSDPVAGAKKFKNAYFCVEGEETARRAAQQIVTSLGGASFTVEPGQKALYHAAAVMSAGHLVALFDLALEMLVECGLDSAQAQQTLLPLVQSTVDNLSRQSPASALTGTFARADVETMKLHLAALSQNAAAASVYRALGRRALKIAARQNADARKLQEMATILNGVNFDTAQSEE